MFQRDEFDVCVIGTGAGGGVMIKELTQAGFSVVALERGPVVQPSQFIDDELSIVVRAELFSPDQLETSRRFGRSFATLETGQQDEVLAALEAGRAAGWPDGEVTSSEFFETVRSHTVLSFLADPKYGGNRDHAGWKVIGYPGPRHRFGAYTTEQTRGEADIPTVWGGKLPR